MGGTSKFSGLLYCADCGARLSYYRGRTIEPNMYGFICSSYRKHMGQNLCSTHLIRECVLEQIVLEEIRGTVYYVRTHTDEFVRQIQKKSTEENRRDLNRKAKELAQMEKRDKELNLLFTRIYEDHVMDRISEDQFQMLSRNYNEEQKQIQERLPGLRQEIESLKDSTANVEQFVALANKYTDPQELTPELLRTFIDKIVIHERETKWSKKGVQQIDIYFRYIGCMPLSGVEEEATV